MRSLSDRSQRLASALVLLACVGLYAATTNPVVNHDVQAASLASWRIANTGAPWMEGLDLTDLGTSDFEMFNGPAANGHEVIHRSPGVVAVGIPAYWITSDGATSLDEFSLGPESATAALLGGLAVWLMFLALRRFVPLPVALLATSVFALGTPMWSIVGSALWTHTVTVLAIAGMSWAAARERWWLVGVFGGVAVWGRLHTAVIVAVLGLGVALARRRPGVALAVGLPSAAMLALATVWTRWMYGTWSPAGGYQDYADNVVGGSEATESAADVVVNQLGLWVAPDRGILVWTPLMLLLLPALARGWRDLPDWARWLPIGGVVYMLVQGQLNEFMGGNGFFGHRLGMELVACAVPAYALTAHRMGAWARRLVGPIIGLQIAVFAVGAVGDWVFLSRYDAWTDNAFLLGLRTIPAIGVWVLLIVLIGALASVVWQRRPRGDSAPRDRAEVSPPVA